MRLIRYQLLVVILLTFLSCGNASKGKETGVLIKTNYGNVKVKLYNETPKHRDNFLKQIEDGNFVNILFHRVMKGFMIQGGVMPPDSTLMGIPSELDGVYPKRFHRRGVLSASRWGDERNPEKLSDPQQFYIVTGERFYDYELKDIVKNKRKDDIVYTDEQHDAYKTEGGAPHLDNIYTVFGEVVEGMDVVDKIEKVTVNDWNKPLKDVVIEMQIVD